jgi:hypothetical protein
MANLGYFKVNIVKKTDTYILQFYYKVVNYFL